MRIIDGVLVNIAASLLSGCSIAAFLVAWNHKLADRTFWGQNPFQAKRAALNAVDVSVFAAYTLLGMLLEVGGEVYGDVIVGRQHSRGFYGVATAMLFLAVATLLGLSLLIARYVAFRRAAPEWALMQKDQYRRVVDVVRGDGMFKETREQILPSTSAEDIERARERDSAQAAGSLASLEDLFDLHTQGDLAVRLAALERHAYTPKVLARIGNGEGEPEPE